MTGTKTMLAAALVAAAFTTPALAQGLVPFYNNAPQSYETQAPIFGMETRSHGIREHRLIEGRNAAVRGDFDAQSGTSTGRDAMVQELGN